MPWTEVRRLPWTTVEAGVGGPRSHEAELIYLCDWPGCTNVAEHALGCVKELGACVALCAEHGNGGGPSYGAVKTGQHS
jgi:hypothetical protein